jgi:hypothetical protein
MEFQHVNVKLFVKNAEEVDLASLIPVFHSWIQDQAKDELLLDVADYRHVHAGPGLVLIGHQGNYSLDNTGDRLGVRYNCKAVLEGTNQDRLVQAAQAALAACQRLETEPSLAGMIQFNGREIEVFINDRLLAPNRPQTRAAANSEFRTFFSTLFGDIDYAVSYPQDPRSLFGVRATAFQSSDTATLLDNLQSLAQTTGPRWGSDEVTSACRS